MKISIQSKAGTFAENKDIAREIRTSKIMPALKQKKEVTLDFDNVTGVTQSFMHALISDAIREYNDTALDLLVFKNCNPAVKEIVTMVADYMQES